MQEKIATFFSDPVLPSLEISDWDILFKYFTNHLPETRFYLVIDEFTYLIKSDKKILSLLQQYWDLSLAVANLCIILSGSLLGLMSEAVLSHSSPLYGRRTRDILLPGLSFKHSAKFFQGSFQTTVEFFLLVGGIPEYLSKVAPYHTTRELLETEFCHKYGYFYREPYYILSQEFRELKTYFSILNAIAYGHVKPSRIAAFAGMAAREIYPYLDNLQRLGFVTRQTSIFGNAKKGIYLIQDPVLDTWFNLTYKFREEIERGTFTLEEGVLRTYLGKRFERFVLDEVLPRIFSSCNKFGRWWYKAEEIDGIAVNETTREFWCIECKWSHLNPQRVEEILKDLERKAALVRWHEEDRLERVALIGKHIDDKPVLREEGYLVYDLEDLQSLAKTG